jgi:hypothetical protein
MKKVSGFKGILVSFFMISVPALIDDFGTRF